MNAKESTLALPPNGSKFADANQSAFCSLQYRAVSLPSSLCGYEELLQQCRQN